MKHRVVLETHHRARDPTLQRFIKEILSGNISEEMVQLPNDLERSLPPPLDQSAVHLFAYNWECDEFNGSKLNEIPAPTEVFTSEDSGQSVKFQGSRVPRKLRLKVCIVYRELL